MILNIFNEGRHAQDSELVRVFLRMKKLSQIKPPLVGQWHTGTAQKTSKKVWKTKFENTAFFEKTAITHVPFRTQYAIALCRF